MDNIDNHDKIIHPKKLTQAQKEGWKKFIWQPDNRESSQCLPTIAESISQPSSENNGCGHKTADLPWKIEFDKGQAVYHYRVPIDPNILQSADMSKG